MYMYIPYTKLFTLDVEDSGVVFPPLPFPFATAFFASTPVIYMYKCIVHVHVIYYVHVCSCTYMCMYYIICVPMSCTVHVHDVIGDVKRKKERNLRQWKNENESCLRWDSNPRHSVLQTDALPTELPRQPSWQGPNQTCTCTL